MNVDRLSIVKYAIFNTKPRNPILTKAVRSYIDLIHSYAVQSAISRLIDSGRLQDYKTSAQARVQAWKDNSYTEGFELGHLLIEDSISAALSSHFGIDNHVISSDMVISMALVHRLYEDVLNEVESEVTLIYE